METHIKEFILGAEAKALATYSGNSLNVVPVSSVRVVSGKIWLINYFMDKTLVNILTNKYVALVVWKKMMGYQIKGEAHYVTDGEEFDEAVIWVKSILPDRVVKGLIIINPKEIYDISPTKDTKDKFAIDMELVTIEGK